MSTDKQGLKKHTTNINEIARQRLGITRDEYALCQFVQYRSADPRGKKSGWCGDKKDDLAEFIGITRPGLYKMLDRMSLVGLLEIDPSTGFCRVTSTWIDTEQNRKLSLQSGVNLVYKQCKLSLQNSVNLVTHNIEEKEIEKEERECEGEKRFAPPPPAESETVEAEIPNKKDFPPSPAETAPPARAAAALTYDQYPLPKNSQELKEALRNYFVANPREWQDGVLEQGKAANWPPEKIGDCMTAFCAHQESEGNFKRTYGQYKGMLVKWFLGQPSFDRARGEQGQSSRKQADQPNQPSPYRKLPS